MNIKEQLTQLNTATEDLRAITALLLEQWANDKLNNKGPESYQERLQKQWEKK